MIESFSILGSISAVPTEYPTILGGTLYVLGIAFLLVLNGFFVASEFAIVKVRPSQIEGELERKPRRAKISKQRTRPNQVEKRKKQNASQKLTRLHTRQ